MNTVFKYFIIISFSLGWVVPLFSATWYSQSNGTWGDTGTAGLWNTAPNGTGTFFDGTDFPSSGDDIVIQSNHQIEIVDFSAVGNFLDVRTLTVESDAVLFGTVTGLVISVHSFTVTVDGIINYPTLTLVSSATGNFYRLTGSGSANLETISFKHSLVSFGASIDLNTTLNGDFYPLDVPANNFTGNFVIEPAATLTVNGSLYLDSDARTNYASNQYDLNSLLQVKGKLTVTGDLHIGNNNSFLFDLILQVDPDGTLQLSTGAILGGNGLSGSGTSTVSVDGTLATAATDPFQDMNSRFLLRMNAMSICRLEGDSNQLLDADVDGGIYYSVELAGTGPKLLSGNVEIQNTINLGTNLQLGNFDLYLSRQLNGGFSGGSATPSSNNSFIDTNGAGRVTAWVGGGNIDFRIGNGTYNNIRTTNLSTAPKGYMVMWVESGVNPAGPGTTASFVNRTWHLEKVSPATNFKFHIQLYWTLAAEQSNFDRQACWVARHDGSNWDTDTPLSAGALAITRSDVTVFGTFSVASSGVVPVELIDFTAVATGNGHLLTWHTASEQNNCHFEIEHSPDGLAFTKIGQVAGQGNSEVENTYTWLYLPEVWAPAHYYRLKQVDFDGQYTYSYIVALENSAPLKTDLLIYPNPAADILTIQIPSGSREFSQLQIFSIDGRRIWSQSAAAGDWIEIPIREWQAGTYLVYGGMQGQLVGRLVKE